MHFILFPFFIPTLLRKFKAQFQENPDPNFDWFYYSNGKDLNVTEEDYQAYRKYFLQSIYWSMVWFVLGIAIVVYIWMNPWPSLGFIFNYLYIGIGLGMYFSSVGNVKGAFVKATDSELWVTNLSDKFGARPKIRMKSPARIWWEFNKPGFKYFGIFFPGVNAAQIFTEGITSENRVAFIISCVILATTLIWIFVESIIDDRKEKNKHNDIFKERQGERNWESYQRELDAKLNPKKSKKKQEKEQKKLGKVKLKKYKGETSNE